MDPWQSEQSAAAASHSSDFRSRPPRSTVWKAARFLFFKPFSGQGHVIHPMKGPLFWTVEPVTVRRATRQASTQYRSPLQTTGTLHTLRVKHKWSIIIIVIIVWETVCGHSGWLLSDTACICPSNRTNRSKLVTHVTLQFNLHCNFSIIYNCLSLEGFMPIVWNKVCRSSNKLGLIVLLIIDIDFVPNIKYYLITFTFWK